MLWLVKCCIIQRNSFTCSTKELLFNSTTYLYGQWNNHFDSTNYL